MVRCRAVDFLEFFGSTFDRSVQGVRVTGELGTFRALTPQVLATLRIAWIPVRSSTGGTTFRLRVLLAVPPQAVNWGCATQTGVDPLVIEDPTNEKNNVGRTCAR